MKLSKSILNRFKNKSESGMPCPTCGAGTVVLETRALVNRPINNRTRICEKGHRFFTVEYVVKN